MTEEERTKEYFEYTNRGWTNPTKWEDLPASAKYLWTERLKKRDCRNKNK